jgi:chemotaxis protein MotB
MNNWMLSSARAEATRAVLSQNGIGNERFMRIEGVADREPFIAGDRYDPRNRRMSVILGWSKGLEQKVAEPAQKGDYAVNDALTDRRRLVRDERVALAEKEMRKIDLGRTALPTGATVINPGSLPKKPMPPGMTEATVRQKTAKEEH